MKKLSALSRQLDENYYTPDMPRVMRKEAHYVFIPDNMMRGEARHHKLTANDDYNYFGKAFTKTATYGIMIMRSKIEPTNALYFEVVPNKESAFVYGDLYEVSPETLVDLDYHQANNLITMRKEVSVVLQKKNAEVKAWMYLADPNYFSDTFNERLSPYTLREYLWNVPVIAWAQSIFQ